MTKRVVVASGYFNPLHYGHVSYLEKAKSCPWDNRIMQPFYLQIYVNHFYLKMWIGCYEE